MILTSIIDPDWCIVENQFDIAKNRHYESVFSLGTGFMTTRASIEEGFENDDQSVEFERRMDNTTLEKPRDTKSRWGTFIPVIQADHPNLRTGIVNLPYYLGLVIKVDGEKLDMEKSKIHNHCRWLELKTGTLYRRLSWETSSGKQVDITWRRFMNPQDRFMCVQDVAISSSQAVELALESFIDNNVRTNGFDKFVDCRVKAQADLIVSDVVTNRLNRVITASQCFYNLPVVQKIEEISARKIAACALFHLESGKPLEIRKISVTASDLYFPPMQLLESVQALISENCKFTGDALHERHCSVWADLWRKSDIEIQAEDTAGYNSQLAIRSAIFHLLKAKGLEDRALLDPKGSTTEAYYGSVFWDYECFMLPFFIYTHPDLARTGPAFRYRSLEAARKLAQECDYLGAKYPWQSDSLGNETCVPWQYADHQVHISADVALGVWHYVNATGDKEFLYDKGAEIIIETARFWTKRVDRLPGREGLHILGVMGPDEYKPITNNNAFTNFVARLNLNLAVQVAGEMKLNAPHQYERLIEKIHLSETELKDFMQIASEMNLPQDMERNIIWQCDHFDTDYAEIDIQGMWKDHTRLFGFYVSQEKRYRSKVIKQADVLALIGVFPDSFTQEQKAASFKYYEPFTIHDSSNSYTHRQMVAANLGWADVAYESWLRAIDIDFGNLPRSGEGLHYANVGGMWQQVVFGFCGLTSALNKNCLVFKPCLPEAIKSIRFPLLWKGHRLSVTVTHDSVSLQNESTLELTYWVFDKKYTVPAGKISVEKTENVGV
jgi:kojibiose phosphorylase